MGEREAREVLKEEASKPRWTPTSEFHTALRSNEIGVDPTAWVKLTELSGESSPRA